MEGFGDYCRYAVVPLRAYAAGIVGLHMSFWD